MEFTELNFNQLGAKISPKNDKILLIDADTIAYNAAIRGTVEFPLLPKEFYSEEEYDALMKRVDTKSDIYRIFDPAPAKECWEDKMNRIMEQTGCDKAELHFTLGRSSFRYQIFPDYKAHRLIEQGPLGILETKVELGDIYESHFHKKYEADDAVIAKYKSNPDKYILCAVDKDVLNSVPGRHFRYYEKSAYVNSKGVAIDAINMDFVEVDKEYARIFPFIQCILGDPVDNIPKIAGIGPAKISNIIRTDMSNKECWDTVVKLWGDEEKALLVMRLVNMHQLKDGDIKLITREEIIE